MNKTRNIRLTPEAFAEVAQAMGQYNGSVIEGAKTLHRLTAQGPVILGLKLCLDAARSLRAGHWDYFDSQFGCDVVYRIHVE